MPMRPGGEARPVVQRVHLGGGKALEQAVRDHRLGAGVALLARLEDAVDRAVEALGLVQVLRRREEHRRVPVVAAAVHAALVARLVRELVLLLHRQRVHVGAQADRASVVVARTRDHRDHAGLADAGVMLDAERGELLVHHARGPVLLEAELGMGVQITANGGEFVVTVRM